MDGVVVRRSGDKTVAVEVVSTVRHRLYGKSATVTKRYLTHDPRNTAEVGQKVRITASRPLSARKRWSILY